ncbi:MAG: lipoyl(octanoyl) transferase LipB [Anaerolineae bacterium]|nr:lipoyl(octanoyl) transferase LipB [Anaerolineae bacterium]
MEFVVEDLGLIDYKKAWKLQDEYTAEIAVGKRLPTLLLLEHPHVYTFGRKGRTENLLWSKSQLEEMEIDVHWVDRGGDVTYHGPGQLVGYPLWPLGKVDSSSRIPRADYVGFIRKLEKSLIRALARLGLVAGQRSGLTGVWVQADVWARCPRCKPEHKKKPAKIAAIGIKVDARGVSRHGFALNVNPDMKYWEGIQACGLSETPIACLDDLTPTPNEMKVVKDKIIQSFSEVFGYLN